MVSDLVSAVRERDAHRSRVPSSLRTVSMLGDEDVEVAGYVRLRLSAHGDARALVLQALEDRGLAVDAAVDLAPAQLLVLTGVAPRAVHNGALETLDTLSAVEQIECTLDRVEVQAAR
jgi:hypothetical protein